MILVDANLLLYAVFEDTPGHERAIAWLDGHLGHRVRRLGLPWPSLLAFLRIATNPRVWARPLPPDQAWSIVEAWLGQPAVWIPQPGPDHAAVLGRLHRAVRPVGNLVPDAHLAALAIEHGLELASTDSDFARFPGLRWTNPLAAVAHDSSR